MEAPYNHGRAVSAALALIFLFAMATSSGFLKILLEKQEYSFLCPKRHRPAVGRRRLAGPGSSPPICRSRCGGCLPCQPIHVSIQPGETIPLEYYPEAWRCKCRNKLFIP